MSGEKTEDPTPSRLAKLREKGDVPLSREIDKAAALLGAVVALVATAPSTARGVVALTQFAWADDVTPTAALLSAGAVLVAGAAPVAAAAAVAGTFSTLVQTQALFAPQRLAPDAARFSPGQVWAQKLKVDTLINGSIALIATGAAAAAAAFGVWQLVRASEGLAEAASEGGVAGAIAAVSGTMTTTVTWWIGIACVAALVDGVWQHQAFRRRNRMSLQEVRDEYRNQEGDPRHKAERERAHREIVLGSIRDGVQRADVVVVNPEHIAVGLRYRPDEVDAPVVTVTGRGERAKQIKREARRRAVPEFEDRAVARAIMMLEVGDEVPDDLFEAVAVVFRWLATLGQGQRR